MTNELVDKPKCPKHPNSKSVDARTPGTEERQWICLACGAKLGKAPPREAQWESQTIKR